jgi:hypothetical protein
MPANSKVKEISNGNSNVHELNQNLFLKKMGVECKTFILKTPNLHTDTVTRKE